ncbi:hypothetical protein HETIRDRAFT_410558 [Heterobasidion irregulare TC 32-1]|uniref:Uncharacterized protein n=1 Tax=Heterobasidion irregulare (strain TC 32-1) TaxID=747525 RepID=W4K2P3_HETIT|nr:uncharacterized protein HETIRDRAFT_410558 [Heterobasidion irregulare TC 32-1]ETW80087.1 hypothetical protein HETIRDRAFT_410558 [Heterobasidion irregulare TC 32-1]
MTPNKARSHGFRQNDIWRKFRPEPVYAFKAQRDAYSHRHEISPAYIWADEVPTRRQRVCACRPRCYSQSTN